MATKLGLFCRWFLAATMLALIVALIVVSVDYNNR